MRMDNCMSMGECRNKLMGMIKCVNNHIGMVKCMGKLRGKLMGGG